MAGQKLEPRATRFVSLIAQQLCKEKSLFTLPKGASNLEVALRNAVSDLPQGPLRSSLESNFTAYVELIQENIKGAGTAIDLQTETVKRSEDVQPVEALKTPLEVAQGSLLSNSAYSRAVEAASMSAKRGIEEDLVSAWRVAVLRILQSRSHPPLALLWAYVAIQRSTLTCVRKLEIVDSNTSSSRIAAARSLLQSLRFNIAGFYDGPTSIAALAPVVCMIIDSFDPFRTSVTVSKDASLSDKRKVKLWKSLQKLIHEVSGFIALCHHRESPPTDGLFKALSVSIGLGIWLSQDSELSALFPYAPTAAIESISNFPESSILKIGEIVEIEVALLRLVAEVVHERKVSKQHNSQELEKKLKNIIIVHASFLGSSEIILDMLLNAPLLLCDILDFQEEFILRSVLSEVAVRGVPNLGISNEVRSQVSSPSDTEKKCVMFVKRVAIARELATHFRSRGEHLRASAIFAALHSRGAPAQLGDWLRARSSLKLLITTKLLQQPRSLLDWLLKASDADFNVVLEKASVQQSHRHEAIDSLVADVDTEMGKDEGAEDSLFFFDTMGVSKGGISEEAPESRLDPGQAFLMAAGKIRENQKEDVIFHRVEQVERKRGRVAEKVAMAKSKKQASETVRDRAPDEDATSEDDLMSDIESEEDARMSD